MSKRSFKPTWTLPFFAAACCSLGIAQDVEMDRFERTTVCTNLVQPMEVDIAADGSIFLSEIGGVLKKIDPKTGRVLEVGKVKVTTEQENGLIGLALDPDFAKNGWIYLQYSPPDFQGQHISRFDFRDNQLDLASEKLLLKYEEQRQQCCHHAGSLEFGPDGNLYVGTGDNTNPFTSQGYAPLDDREDRMAWDSQRSASNTKSYNGKILRIHPEADGTYSIPEGNLFPKDGGVGYPEIYVMGCRNPWRISIDSVTGYLYWGDVGPDATQDNDRGPRGYDEINQATQAGYFGWPYFIGDNFGYALVDFATGKIQPPQNPAHPKNVSANNTGAKELPPANPAFIYYPTGPSEKFPELGSGGRSACAGPVYRFKKTAESTTKFPEAYDATLFAFDWTRHWLMAIHLDEDSQLTKIEPFLPSMKFVRPTDMVFDRSGSMYLIEYGETWGVNPDAKLTRIDYVRGNRTPVAVANIGNSIGREPLTVDLSAEGSDDKDRDSLTFEWTAVRSVDNKIVRRQLATGRSASATFEEPGVYTVELTAIDPSGARGVTTLPVIVGNTRPEVTFVSPKDGDLFLPGGDIAYRLKVRDVEDGSSDVDEVDNGNAEPIEARAPQRLLVEAVPAKTDTGPKPLGLELILKSDCLNCHAANRKLVGPSFVEVADKYRDQPHQLEISTKRVLEGSTGVWGKVAMLPHAQHTPEQIQQMLQYIFSVSNDSANPSAFGFNNTLKSKDSITAINLEAAYTDLGRGEVPPLMGTSSVALRSRKQKPSAADESSGVRARPGRPGAAPVSMLTEDGSYLAYRQIPLDQFKRIVFRVSGAADGTSIEVRRDRIDGELLGRTDVESNSDRNQFYETTVACSEATGRHDVYLVFKNESRPRVLLSLDWVQFLKD